MNEQTSPTRQPPEHVIRRQGRHRNWSRQRLRRLLSNYRSGADTPAAAAAAGISARVVEEWLRRGRNGEYPYARLAAAVDRAIGKWEAETFATLNRSRVRDWRAAAWQLERSPHTRARYGAQEAEQTDAQAALAQLFSALAGRATAGQQPTLPPASDTAD